ncbi:MAG: hypothetical protein ABEJ35_00530 [Halobacteriaceae archaeon]
MDVSEATVQTQREWVQARGTVIVPLINEVRTELSAAFDADVAAVDRDAYAESVEALFEAPDRAINAAALIALLRELDVVADYPGFIVDELLGRELAATIAGEQPLRLLAQATFHFADIVCADAESAGADDLDAALAAGFQTRLPGWAWRDQPAPL